MQAVEVDVYTVDVAVLVKAVTVVVPVVVVAVVWCISSDYILVPTIILPARVAVVVIREEVAMTTVNVTVAEVNRQCRLFSLKVL